MPSLVPQFTILASAHAHNHTDKGFALLLVYVDDMIITGDDIQGIQDLKWSISQEFEMKDLSFLNHFLV